MPLVFLFELNMEDKMAKLTDIEGIGDVYAQTLQEAGITTLETLREQGATPQGRKQIAEQTGLSNKLILRWVNHADLFRIKGISSQYSELLEAAGVDTIPELAQRNPENLHQKLIDVNHEKKLVRQVAGLGQVSDWVRQAQELPRVITY